MRTTPPPPPPSAAAAPDGDVLLLCPLALHGAGDGALGLACAALGARYRDDTEGAARDSPVGGDGDGDALDDDDDDGGGGEGDDDDAAAGAATAPDAIVSAAERGATAPRRPPRRRGAAAPSSSPTARRLRGLALSGCARLDERALSGLLRVAAGSLVHLEAMRKKEEEEATLLLPRG